MCVRRERIERIEDKSGGKREREIQVEERKGEKEKRERREELGEKRTRVVNDRVGTWRVRRAVPLK